MVEVYDVFISYRRDGGFETAKHLNDLLVHDGYSVSFDIDTLREGDFDLALLKRIEQCRDFLLIIDTHAFDRMINPAPDYDPEKDWLRVEITYALQLKKNIISIMLAGASFPVKMPEGLERLDTKNGPKYSKEYFDSFYNKLKGFLHSTPRNQNPVFDSDIKKQACLKIKADLDCTFYLDGEEWMVLKAGKIGKLPLAEGEYELEFVGLENVTDCLEMAFEMPPKDTVLHISLAEKRAARLGKEIAKQREQEEKTRQAREKAEQEAKREAFQQDQIFTINGVSFVMKPVDGGNFQMGSNDSIADDCEKPVHNVILSNYYIGETVVTQALWKAVMSNNPSYFKGDNLPVENVSYNDIVDKFLPQLNRFTGKCFRLPTEAEWEYAARGGILSNGYKYAGDDYIDNVAWYWKNSGDNYLNCTDNDWDVDRIRNNNGRTRVVKCKKPNELGLYDMSGNVWEWCQDWYDNYTKGSQTNPQGPSNGSNRVLRGGSWLTYGECCRVSIRFLSDPDLRYGSNGFRLVLLQ